MAFEADRVVVELIAKVDQFDRPVQSSAQSFDASMNKISASATKAEQAVTRSSANRARAIERESAQIGNFSRLLGTQLNDVGALLTSARSPFVVPQREAPKVASALRLVQVGGAAMAGVIGGVAVTATFALVEALADLITKGGGASAEIKGMVEKLKEHAEKTNNAERAQAIFAETLEGVTQAIKEDEKALAALNREQVSSARQALINAERRLLTLQGLRDETEATLDAAKAQQALNKARLDQTPGREFEAQAARFEADAKNVDALDARLGRIDGLITRQRGRIDQALSFNAVEIGKQLADPLERINAKYDGLIDAARKRAIAEGTVRSELVKQTQELERQRKAALDAARKQDRGNQQSGRQINLAQARSIVEGIGGTVTSGFRSVQHNEDVGGVKGSFHTKGQALDIAKTAGLTLGKIVKAFEAQGVRLIEKLDEGDHFHIAFAKRGGGRSGPSAETLARRAEAARIAEENERQAHQNEMAGLNAAEIDARQALITSAEEIAKLEVQAIEVSRQKYNDNLLHLQSIGKLQETEVVERTKVNDEIAKLRTELVQRREEQRLFRMREAAIERQEAVSSGSLQAQQELLQSQQGIARTQRDRLAIGQRLVDLQYQEERLALQAAIAREARLRAEYARTKSQETLALLEQAEVDAAIARQRLGTIDQRQGAASQGNSEANASPLQSYFGDIQAQADDLNTAFERIAAGGLTTFTDALTNAIVNFTSLGDVGRAVLAGLTADLVRLAIQQIIVNTLGKLFNQTMKDGGASAQEMAKQTATKLAQVAAQQAALQAIQASFGAASAAAAAALASTVAAAWAPAAAAASLATLGGNAGPAAAALVATNALAMGLAQAGKVGGFRSGGYTGDIPENMVAGAVHGREFVFDAPATRRIGVGNLEALRSGAVPSNDRAARISPLNMEARRPGGAPADLSGMRSLIGEAVAAGISAMPEVHNFIGFDPDALVAKALGSQATVNRLIEVLGQNSTKAKAALN